MSQYGETHRERLARKARDSPFMVVGLVGLVGVVGYGIYGFRKKQLKTSVYLIHTRVVAQGLVVLCLTGGIAINLFNKYAYPRLFPSPSIEDKNPSPSIEDKKD